MKKKTDQLCIFGWQNVLDNKDDKTCYILWETKVRKVSVQLNNSRHNLKRSNIIKFLSRVLI